MPWATIDDNFEMYYDVDNFTDPWKTPQTVVLHHGIAKSSRFWYGWLPTLARHYQVVRLDARGFGQSTVPPPGYRWSLSSFARDLRCLLDCLELDRVHLVGETLGGVIAMQFAYEYPERLHSLTISSSPHRHKDPHFLEFAEEADKEGVLPWGRRSMWQRLDRSQVDPAFVEWYASEMGKTTKHVVVEVLKSLVGDDLSDILRQIQAPTLMLSAENRPNYPPEEVQEAQGLIANSQLVVFPGVTGYAAHSRPEDCARALLAFLRGL